MAGFIRNRVEESIADLTKDRPVNMPGKEAEHLEVEKKHLKDDYVPGAKGKFKVFSQWEISFARRSYGLNAASAEDTLPSTEMIEPVQRVYDTYVAKETSSGELRVCF